jgi:hypothetical protein
MYTCALNVREKRMYDEHFLPRNSYTKKRTFLFPHEKDFTCDLKYSLYHSFTNFKRARRAE